MEEVEMSGELRNFLTDFITHSCKENNNSISTPAWKGVLSRACLPSKQLATSLFIHLNLAVK